MLPCSLGVCHPGQIGLEMNLTSVSSCSLLPAVLGFPGGSVGKASACNAGDLGSIPESERSPGEGNGNPLQYSCLENPMDSGAWQATVHGVAKSRTQLSDFTSLTAAIIAREVPNGGNPSIQETTAA